jgi:4,5-DOPA dioxygenase extradiol
MMVAGEYEPLIDYEALGRKAISIPTLDHYLPLLYVLPTTQNGEAITFSVEGVRGVHGDQGRGTCECCRSEI